MQDKFEQHIKSRLENHSEVPPPSAWDNISEALHEDKPKAFVWSKWMGVAAAILVPALLTIGIYWFISPIETHKNSEITQVDNSSEDVNSIKGNTDENSNSKGINLQHPSETANGKLVNTQSALAKSPSSTDVVKDFLHSWLHIDARTDNDLKVKTIANHTKSSNFLNAISKIFVPTGKSELSEPALYAFYNSNPSSTLQVEVYNATAVGDDEDITKTNNSNQFDRVEIRPYAGVAMLNSFEQPSLIAPEFNDLKVDNSVVTSYGSNASYRINDRLKIRSGIGVMNFNQDTYDVPMKLADSESKNAYNTQGYTNLTIDFSEANQVNNMYASMESNTTRFKKDISHEVQYIEVPLEMEYRLTQGKKLNVAATGGLSTLILNKNDVYLKELNEVVAKSTNLKSVSFSANAGVKVDYNITEKVSVNVEPQLRYMMNTVTANDEIQPYLLAMNAGISYAL